MRTFTCATATATAHAKSEDRVRIIEHGDVIVVVLADGAGGQAGGGDAADAFMKAAVTRLERASFDPFNVRAWSETFVEVDKSLVGSGETTRSPRRRIVGEADECDRSHSTAASSRACSSSRAMAYFDIRARARS